jgi:hypothetical protein
LKEDVLDSESSHVVSAEKFEALVQHYKSAYCHLPVSLRSVAEGDKLPENISEWAKNNCIIWRSFGGKNALYSVVKEAREKEIKQVLVDKR